MHNHVFSHVFVETRHACDESGLTIANGQMVFYQDAIFSQINCRNLYEEVKVSFMVRLFATMFDTSSGPIAESLYT